MDAKHFLATAITLCCAVLVRGNEPSETSATPYRCERKVFPNMKPSHTCAALLNIGRQSFFEAELNAACTRDALHFLRHFRHDLGFADAVPKLRSIAADFDPHRSNASDFRKAAEQIRGIEDFLLETEDLQTERQLIAFQIRGARAVPAFFDDVLNLASERIPRVVNEPGIWLYKKRLRVVQSIVPFLLLYVIYGPVQILDPWPMAPMAGALMLATEPFANLRYAFKSDSRYVAIQKAARRYLDGVAARRDESMSFNNPSQQAPWSLRSWETKTLQVLPDTLLQKSIHHADSQGALRGQEMWDSRGTVFRIYRRKEWFEDDLRSRRRAVGGPHQPTLREYETPVHIYFDQLLTVDPETKDPLLTFVIRTSRKRPIFPQSAPARSKAQKFTPALVPERP